MVTIEELREAAKEMGVDKGPNGFYDWQEEIIWDRVNRKILMNCGRKASKTTCVEFRQATRLLNDPIAASGVRGGMAITADESEGAELILQGVADVLEVMGWEFTSERAKKSESKKIFYMTRKEIQMPNGNRSFVITSKWGGRTMRKYSFYEIDVDEADLITNEFQFYSAIRPCLGRYNGVLLLESTPNLEGNRKTYFAKAFFGVDPDWKIYHIPTTEVPHIDPEWIRNEYKGKAREYAREILAEYISDIGGVFPTEIINSCFTEEEIEWRAENAFIGAQYASFQTDTSVIAENFYRDEISYIRIGLIPHYGRRIMEVENEIVTMVKKNGITRVIINNTTLGSSPIESMAEQLGAEMVVGVSNHDVVKEIEGARRKYMKEDLYVNLLKLMERGLVRFNDRRIIDALMDVKYDYSKRNKQIYISGNDITDAIVRAVFPVWGRREFLGKIPQKFMFFDKIYK